VTAACGLSPNVIRGKDDKTCDTDPKKKGGWFGAGWSGAFGRVAGIASLAWLMNESKSEGPFASAFIFRISATVTLWPSTRGDSTRSRTS
jgi:hypothetical protein